MFTQQELSQVVEGMEVYDKDGNQIGTVADFREGEGTMHSHSVDLVTKVDMIADQLGGRRDLPTVLYSRMYEEGFVRIKRGLFRRDVLLFPDQIEGISVDSIHLTVDLNELPRI